MKKIILIFSIILISSCGAKSKLNKKNFLKVDRIGIMDSITVNVGGKVTDIYDKFPLKGAYITLKNPENEYSEVAKKNGEFSFNHISSGKYEIISSFVGYCMLRDSIELKSGEIIKLEIELGYDE